MSKAIRIRTTPNGADNYIKVKLEQDFDFLEILSLNINQEDVYQRFSSDYGVVVGRVIINSGFGVPNAKVSVFIPIDEIDKNNPLIKNLYPYEKTSDVNSDGVRYNVLSPNSESINNCFTPVGTFPSKREVLDNETMLEIYCKYYKFTTTTNHAGDFMIFGVPLGNYTVHVDADISDIGIASQRPYDLINQGTPLSQFDSTTKFSSGTNLNKLPQIKSLDTGVTVQPFWGDTDNYEIGITRLDLDLNFTITPSAIFMGSIFGDQDKHSVNKNCRPRKDLGVLNEQITTEGTIRMIRKTLDNKIEEFNIDGSELIDEHGAWAYQIPMNLDYMVTDEFGNLILTQDPNKGIPTRARVRFDIGMKNTGGEGRVRTRARYLVPNNPLTQSDIDYEFGSKTKDHSFRDLHWNKIYTVSNFISRFQRTADLFSGPLTRAATGIKDVDGGLGNKTPFPYNKVNTETSPLFMIICLIMTIIVFIMFIMNYVLIRILNALIRFWNQVMGAFCSVSDWRIFHVRIFGFLSFFCDLMIDYVPCLIARCDGQIYSPGCQSGSDGFDSVSNNENGGTPKYYYGDEYGHGGPDCGLGDCIAFEMAKALHLFQFDFYNDWINGTLFSFLLKYKKRRNKKEKFCEYNCDDIAGGGLDGNGNGIADNNCVTSLVMDTCTTDSGDKNAQNDYFSYQVTEGLVKKVGTEFYYAATTKNNQVKLFATELVSLGSVFECDWQGIPKIQQYLIPTTYKLPPDTQEFNDAGTVIETSGMVDIGGNTCGVFFGIDCAGLHTNSSQCLNIRRICEMGVDIDQAQFDPNTNAVLINADCIIGTHDIDDNHGKWVRDVFFGMNETSTPWTGLNSISIPAAGYSTDFNLTNVGSGSDFTTVDLGNNGQDYIDFRNYSFNHTTRSYTSFAQPDHSYFFYFGLEPGNTGLDKMNKKYFASCIQPLKDEILIESTSTPDLLNLGTGCTTFSFVGGVGMFNYIITGLYGITGQPLNITPISGSCLGSGTTICGLHAGTYSIAASDSLGTPVSDTITVNGPTPLYCYVNVNQGVTSTAISSDGSIIISNVGGGFGALHYTLTNSSGTFNQTGLAQTGLVLGGLPIDDVSGYTMTIYDQSTPVSACTTTGLTITGPNNLNISYSATNIHCSGMSNGKIKIIPHGGIPAYNVNVTGPNNYTSTGSLNLNNLAAGQYTITLVDGAGTTAGPISVNITTDNPPLAINTLSAAAAQQCDPNNYHIPFSITSGVSSGMVNIQYSLDSGQTWIDNPMPYSSTNDYMLILANSNIFEEVQIRYWVDNNPIVGVPPCYSDSIAYSISEIMLPPMALGIKDDLLANNTPANAAIYQNAKQCDPNIGTYTFSINQLDAGFTARAPYTIEYKVENSTTVNTQQVYNGLVALTGLRDTTTAPVDNFVDFHVRVKDNLGCYFPSQTGWYDARITLPTAAMNSSIITTGPNGSGIYTHKVTVTGGIAPLKLGAISGYPAQTIVAGTQYTFNTNSLVYVNTVTANNGCTLNLIG